MGPVQGEDFGIGPGSHQFFQHLAAIGLGFTYLAIELAIGKGAGTTLAQLGIGFGVEWLFATPEPEGVGAALFHRLAPLQ